MNRSGKAKARRKAEKESKLSQKQSVNRKVAYYSGLAKTLLKGRIFTYIAPPKEGINPLSGERIVKIDSGKSHRIDAHGGLKEMMTYSRFRWSIYIAVMCRDKDGRKAMEPTIVTCKAPQDSYCS